ncbi:MAG: hypothetical protein Q8P24_18000 [Desulfobacterales bacterium]|nr:hypothetical protein [Desulfobacterales bacterium]
MEKQINSSGNTTFDPDDWAGDQYWERCRVTNSMDAALVVAMWSQMERFLKLSFPHAAKQVETENKS